MTCVATTGRTPGEKSSTPVTSVGTRSRCSLGEDWWVNKVGTYGMASAQSYWGRLAALLLRVLYALFPQVDWNFVFVDDFRLLRSEGAVNVGGGIAGYSPGIGHPT